ncbi:translocation/assembly module TamB domain-containing protein [uncultured Shimia sp.]|uniref:translocation/assembly module TamB domain-containing protein n=1 Tax=uncultured Shimia sp. TaxID=573152 RepID=UPI00262B3FEB|nr:translocation/assembly module TamB domain-containing protein [uncultured Shimia sp.]
MRWLYLIWLCFLPLAAFADEEEDKGRLTTFLESTLSGAGREVTIEGFQGALSSNASIDRLIISDADGPWLTLSDVDLIWTRSALLRGRVEVDKLTAAEILIDRLPKSEPSAPSPEAGSFSLPELPVRINIGEVNAARVALGETILGETASFSVLGNLSLVDGSGAAALDITRTDGPQGHVRLKGGFDNAGQVLDINLDLTEGDDGIVAALLNIPDKPPLTMSVSGNGPISAYVANFDLTTDGQPRLTGTIGTQMLPELDDQGVTTGEAQVFGVDISGDMAPLFAPEYADFFGPNVSLTTIVRRSSDLRTHLDQLLISTRSFRVQGEMVLAPKGLPEQIAFDIAISDPEGTPVKLPSVNGISLQGANLDLRYDVSQGDGWALRGQMQGLILPEITMASISLDGTGTIRHLDVPDLTADISLRAVGVSATDPEKPDAANAIGEVARIATRFAWKAGTPFRFESLELEAQDSLISAAGEITGPFEELTVTADAEASIRDLAFLEPIIQRPLRGSAEARLSGTAQPLGGAFDLTLSALAENLLTGEPTLDALTGEETALTLSIKRDGDGVNLRDFEFKSEALTADARGDLRTGEGALEFSAALDDVNRLTPDFRGPVTVAGDANETAEGWAARVESTAPGETTISASLILPKTGKTGAVQLDVAIGAVGALVPALSGTASLQAKADQTDGGWKIDVTGKGSSIFELAAQGMLNDDFQSGDLKVSGRVPLELANTLTDAVALQGSSSFDLAINGPFALENLSGNVTSSGARLTAPEFNMALSELDVRTTIAGASATVAVDGAVRAGGRFGVNGAIGLQAPFNGDVTLALRNAIVRYDDLLETELLGEIRINGPLTGGALISGLIDLVTTEINVAGVSMGTEAIPLINHVGETGKTYRTRGFAGVLPEPDKGAGSSAPPFVLDLIVRANNKVFVRGLGLDAEFEGEFGLQGPTNSITTAGEFDLTRGRIDFLTKRLDLTEGVVRLEGDFVPYLRMIAETSTSEASFEIVLEGRATDPDFSVNSSPDMPEEEALSLILFGQNLEKISAIQAAQLASAVASLRGQGGGNGLFGGVRKGIGLDNLDITTDEDGTAGLSAGKHLTESVYTEIEVNGKGESSISLNLDVSSKITVKGRVDSDSDTGIGLFFKHDY